MTRALKNLDSSLGVATIPVLLFTATSSKGVAFHLLHAKCGSRIHVRLEYPIHGIVPREERRASDARSWRRRSHQGRREGHIHEAADTPASRIVESRM
jgi:hypothetical protein